MQASSSASGEPTSFCGTHYVWCVCLACLAPVCACVQENQELDAIWRLLQYYWNKHYQGIWQALQGYQWSQQVGAWLDQ